MKKQETKDRYRNGK